MKDNYKIGFDDSNITENVYGGVFVLMNLQAEGIFMKRRLRHRCFPVNFAKVLRILLNICEGLLLRLTLLCVSKNTIFDLDKQKSKEKCLKKWKIVKMD